MCYHVSKTKTLAQDRKIFLGETDDKLTDKEYAEKYSLTKTPQNAYPMYYHRSGFSHPYLPIISSENPKRIQLMTWGLIPSWVKDVEAAKTLMRQTLNARGDTIFEKPSFRDAIKTRRCLVLVDGFFEWRHEGKVKIPYYVSTKEEQNCMGGIWSEWVNKSTGEIIKTFSIVTTDANPMMEYIHNEKKRMPLILDPAQQELWLSDKATQADVNAVMKPFEEQEMKSFKVNIAINKSDTNIPDVLLPIG